jgi:hypothetical protein
MVGLAGLAAGVSSAPGWAIALDAMRNDETANKIDRYLFNEGT